MTKKDAWRNEARENQYSEKKLLILLKESKHVSRAHAIRARIVLERSHYKWEDLAEKTGRTVAALIRMLSPTERNHPKHRDTSRLDAGVVSRLYIDNIITRQDVLYILTGETQTEPEIQLISEVNQLKKEKNKVEKELGKTKKELEKANKRALKLIDKMESSSN